GGLLTDMVTGNVSQLKSRIGSILGIRKDPYDTFDEILEWLDEQKKQATFFVWVGDYGPQDKGLNWKNPHIRNLVRRLAKNHQIGLHPSYRAFDEPNRLQKEKERLESIAGISITHSRFHFLRFKIPASYNQLIESGFEWDHSLGYSNAFGFRAATSRSFRFYDLNKEASTSLKIQPFSLMDSTAFYELKLDQHEWIAKTIHFRQMLKVLNGHLNVVMHNDVSFFRYKPDFI
ncbi:MAG TPA: polysaccharide deacetylase family protein, partial [Catalimonadaceae bacterium]|nr:polysaccharide deacetylase family protein [Catalimonadaceae bacterium]